MLSRTRALIALLLLLAAAVHPLVHFTEQDCPCAHGAVAQLTAPGVQLYAPGTVTHVEYVPVSVSSTRSGELPARAPPAV